jgi:hypothetical protein
MNTRKYFLLILLMAMFLMAGCANKFTDNAYKTLAVSKETYDSTLSIAGDMYRQGHIQEEQKEKAIEYGTGYMVVHNEAVAALLEYELHESEDAKQKYIDTISDVLSRLSFLIDYVKNLRGGE